MTIEFFLIKRLIESATNPFEKRTLASIQEIFLSMKSSAFFSNTTKLANKNGFLQSSTVLTSWHVNQTIV
ncbi:hypothetical protein [Neobacillus drentensis]|uniref:hypothetical protein n=1 Tax=Neobacillus drentensis TaxID=220684 RepID=UPI00300071ED